MCLAAAAAFAKALSSTIFGAGRGVESLSNKVRSPKKFKMKKIKRKQNKKKKRKKNQKM